jgi:predicted NAD/FAD-binding protein
MNQTSKVEMHNSASVRRIAVVGGGSAGMISAFLLGTRYDVTLFEASPTTGGHARTVRVPDGPDMGIGLDPGFINCAPSAYPRLFKYLAALGVETAPSDPSFCAYFEKTGAQFYFAMGPQGRVGSLDDRDKELVAQLSRLGEFYRRAADDLRAGRLAGKTVGEYFAEAGVPRAILETLIIPLYASLWLVPPAVVPLLSAESHFTFYRRLGLPLLDIYGFQYVKGGCSSYIEALAAGFRGNIRLSTPVKRVSRRSDAVDIALQNGQQEIFDAVVMATHADDALRLLADPSPDEATALGAWTYVPAQVVTHCDPVVIPSDQRSLVSINYFGDDDGSRLRMTMNLNRMMKLDAQLTYFASINPPKPIRDDLILDIMNWKHPVPSVKAVASQPALRGVSGLRRTYFCGSYFGCGSHEDAVASGEAVALKLGVSPDEVLARTIAGENAAGPVPAKAG